MNRQNYMKNPLILVLIVILTLIFLLHSTQFALADIQQYGEDHVEIGLVPNPSTTTSIPAYHKGLLERCRTDLDDYTFHKSPGFVQWISNNANSADQTVSVNEGDTEVTLRWNFAGAICWGPNRVIQTKSKVYDARIFEVLPDGTQVALDSAILSDVIGDVFDHNWNMPTIGPENNGKYVQGYTTFKIKPSGGFQETKTYKIELDTRTINKFLERSGSNSYLCVTNGPTIFVSNIDQFTGGPNGDCTLNISTASINLTINVINPRKYDHNIYHEVISPTSLKVQPGQLVSVSAKVCNAGDGGFLPNKNQNGNAPMVVRLKGPKRFVDSNDNGVIELSELQADGHARITKNPDGDVVYPEIAGATRAYQNDEDARWEINSFINSSFQLHVPAAGSDNGGACSVDTVADNDNTRGRGNFTASFIIPERAKPGEFFCFWAATSPDKGKSGNANSGPGSEYNGTDNSNDRKTCFEVVLKPFFMIMGGDVNVGTVFESQVNAVDSSLQCSALPSSRYDEFLKTSEASIKGHIAFRNFEDDPSDSRPIGPSAEFAIYGLGNVRIPTFDTRKSLGVTKNIGGVFSNYYASNFLTGNTNVLEKGYFYSKDQSGGKDSLAYPPDCVPDYYEIEYDNPDKIKLTSDNYITGSNRLDISQLESGVYYWDGNPSTSNNSTNQSEKYLEIFNTSPATEIDKEIIILSDRDVIIKDNIESKQPVFENGKIEFGAISIIVKGADIKVRYTNENQTVNNCCFLERDRDTITALKFINHVDADLIALPTGNADYTYNSGGASEGDDPDGGNIFTCVGDENPGKYNPQFNIVYGKCRSNLVITGKTIADKIWLLRAGEENQALHAVDQFGTREGRRIKASEIMEMDPNRHFIYHLTGKKGYAGRLETTEDNLIPEIKSYKELPPIY